MIKLYTQPGCTRCPGVERYLTSKKGKDGFVVVDVSTDAEALKHLQTVLKVSSTPVVETDKGFYAGNNQKEIASLL